MCVLDLGLRDRAPRTPGRLGRRRVAARARAGGEAVRGARRVADEREGVTPELGRDQLADAARADRRAALRVQELAEKVPRVEVHALVHAALAGDRADLRLADVVEELDADRRLKPLAERRR